MGIRRTHDRWWTPHPPLPLYEECFHCTSIVQGSVRLSAGRRAGPHARGSTGTSCALLAVARSADISDDEVLRELLELNGGGR